MGVTTRAISAILVVAFASATVSAIPTATTVVVVIITVAIAAETVNLASPIALHFGVLASTVRAVLVDLSWTTAVTAVPCTPTVIVPIVAVVVTTPNLDT